MYDYKWDNEIEELEQSSVCLLDDIIGIWNITLFFLIWIANILEIRCFGVAKTMNNNNNFILLINFSWGKMINTFLGAQIAINSSIFDFLLKLF